MVKMKREEIDGIDQQSIYCHNNNNNINEVKNKDTLDSTEN